VLTPPNKKGKKRKRDTCDNPEAKRFKAYFTPNVCPVNQEPDADANHDNDVNILVNDPLLKEIEIQKFCRDGETHRDFHIRNCFLAPSFFCRCYLGDAIFNC